MEREIENILKNNCYQQYVQAMPEKTYKSIPIERTIPQFIHFVVKLPYGDNLKLNYLRRL